MKLKKTKYGYEFVDRQGRTISIEKWDGFWYATDASTGESICDSESTLTAMKLKLEHIACDYEDDAIITIHSTEHFKVFRLIICGKSHYEVIKRGENGSHLCTLNRKQAIAYCNMLNKLALGYHLKKD